MLKKTANLVKNSVREFLSDNCPLLAAAISFNLLLSLFPLILALITLVSFFFDSPAAREQIIQGVTYLFSASSDLITSIVNDVMASRGAVGVLSIILLIIGGLSFFDAVRKSLNVVWRAPKPQSFLKGEVMDILMMFVMALLFFVAYLILIFINLLGQLNIGFFINFPGYGLLLLHFVVILLDIAILFLVFLSLYRFIPNLRLGWRNVWAGALMAAVFSEAANILFSWYLANFSPYNPVYGSIAAVIAFLIWAYLIALIGLFFAKISSVSVRSSTIA